MFLIRLRVLIPLGQTIRHFPHNMQCFSKETASLSCPFWIYAIALRRLTSVKFPALQVAEQDPHAIHFLNPGSSANKRSCLIVSTLSRSTLELGDNEYPNSFMVIYLDKYLWTERAAVLASFRVSGRVLGPVTEPARNTPSETV